MSSKISKIIVGCWFIFFLTKLTLPCKQRKMMCNSLIYFHPESRNRYRQKSPVTEEADGGKKANRVVFYLFLSRKMMNFTG